MTRLATDLDLREAATILAQQNGRLRARLREVEAQVAIINGKLDRLLAILQAASRTSLEENQR